MISAEMHQQWKAWLSDIEMDVRNLDRTHHLWSQLQNVFWEEELPHWGHWAKYFLDTYSIYAIAAIRRQIRRHRQSISLDGIIQEIKASADQVDYPWWSSFARHGNEALFRGYFGDNEGKLDVAKVDGACREMYNFDNILEVADRRLAHWDRRGIDHNTNIGTEDITRALLALHATLDFIHLLVLGEIYNPNEDYADLDLRKTFTVPWIRPENPS
jgi:hypothetical protein